MPIDGLISIGVWEDLDGPELRSAFKTLGLATMAVVHFEAREVPLEFKVRSCPDRRRDEPFQAWLQRAEQAAIQRQEKVPA